MSDALVAAVVAAGGLYHAAVAPMEFDLGGGVVLRGLGTAAALPSGTAVLRVPLNACLSSADSLAVGGDLQLALEAACAAEGVPQAQKHFLEMALLLLSPRGEALHGGAYRRTLPDGVEHQGSVPFAFTDDALDALQSDALCALVRQRRRWMRAVLARLPDVPPPPTEERLAWALFVVRSRLFNVHLAPPPAARDAVGDAARGAYNAWCKGDVRVLAPLLDMMNHAFPPGANTVRTYDGGANAFVVTTTCDVAAGEQLCVDYSAGRKAPLPNDRLLLSYGFVLAENRDDELLVDFRDDFRACFDAAGAEATDAARALAQTRLLVLKRGGFTKPRARSNGFSAAGFVIGSARDCEDVLRGPLLACARACSTPLAALADPGAVARLLGGGQVDVHCELVAVRLLWRKLIAIVSAFATTASEDAALLAAPRDASPDALVPQVRLAIEFRLAKKRLAQRLLTHFGASKLALAGLARKAAAAAAVAEATAQTGGVVSNT